MKQNVEPKVQAAWELRLKKMEVLVGELIKDKPDLQKVRDLMNDLSLPWSEDSVERLSTVLMAVEGTPARGDGEAHGSN